MDYSSLENPNIDLIDSDDEKAMGLHRLRGNFAEKVSNISAKEILPSVNKRVSKLPKIQRTLAILLVSLQGFEVVIELKNCTEVRGILEESDTNMNLTIHDVTQVSIKGEVKKFNIAFINGTSILYVHLAPNLDVRSHLGSYLSKLKRLKRTAVVKHNYEDKESLSVQEEFDD